MEASQPANSRHTELRVSPGVAHPRADGCTAAGHPRLALARQHTPLLPCGLTEEELAALTAEVEERANSSSPRGTSLDAPPPPTLGRQQEPAHRERVLTVPPASASSTPFADAAGVVNRQADVPAEQAEAEAEAEAAKDRRRSFQRINRVAAAVAAEMARRRAFERRQRQEARSSSRAMLRVLGQAPTLQCSASEGQIQDIMMGAGTPGVSREVQPALTAQRLALAGPGVPAHLPTASHALPSTIQQPPAPPSAAVSGHSELDVHSGVSRVCLSAPQGGEPGWREHLTSAGARPSSFSHGAQSRLARQSSLGETEVTSGMVPVPAAGVLTYAGGTGAAAEAGPGSWEVGGAPCPPGTHALLSVRASLSTPSLAAGTGADLRTSPDSPVTPCSRSRCGGNQQKEAGTPTRKRGLSGLLAAIDRLLRL